MEKTEEGLIKAAQGKNVITGDGSMTYIGDSEDRQKYREQIEESYRRKALKTKVDVSQGIYPGGAPTSGPGIS